MQTTPLSHATPLPESSADWRDIAAKVGDLPPMPHVAARAITIVENPDATAGELSDVLMSDSALAARVLKIANSAMFSRQRKITTLNHAVMTIGFKALKGVIIAAALRQMNKSYNPHEKLVWERSVATAIGATRIATHLKRRSIDELFLAGLLHNLGQVVLLSQRETGKRYGEVLALIAAEGLDFVVAEERVFGFSHPLLGALVAKKWNFSADMCQLILHYRDGVEGSPNDSEQQTMIVRLAEIVSHRAGIGSPQGYPDESGIALQILRSLGIAATEAPAAFDLFVTATRDQFEHERHIYE